MNKDYTYAVARIRGRENYLLSGPAMEQLAASKTYDEALHFLADRGWGDPDERLTAANWKKTCRPSTYSTLPTTTIISKQPSS